jgi:hypothetical protein
MAEDSQPAIHKARQDILSAGLSGQLAQLVAHAPLLGTEHPLD